jgi:hypothetical protein
MFGARFRFLLLAALSGCVLSSCGDPAPETATAAPKAAPKKPSVVENMVAAVSAGKSSAMVSVHFSLGTAPSVRTALPVDIVILPHVDFTTLRARIESQSGLTLISGDNVAPMTGVGAEKPISHKVVLMPEGAGVYMITVNLETEGGEGTVSRIFSIPVIVTPSDTPPAAPAVPAAAPAPAAG